MKTAAISEDELNRQHERSSKRGVLAQHTFCGCFFCSRIFPVSDIREYVSGDLALCPYCGIDALIPDDDPERPLTTTYLSTMSAHFFAEIVEG